MATWKEKKPIEPDIIIEMPRAEFRALIRAIGSMSSDKWRALRVSKNIATNMDNLYFSVPDGMKNDIHAS